MKTRDSHTKHIVDYFTENPGAPRKPRRLARLLDIPADEYPAFREAFRELRKSGKLTASQATTVVGRFRANQRGFGFVKPQDSKKQLEDIYISMGNTAGALTGDRVVVEIASKRGRRLEGRITEIVERGLTRVVGTLEHIDGGWFLEPDGGKLFTPLIVDNLPPGEIATGTKVLADIVKYPEGPGMLPVAAVTEVLGVEGLLETETESMIHAHGLPNEFTAETVAEAAAAVAEFDATAERPEREDLTALMTVTIDPVDARDFDDAISLEPAPDADDGTVILGVHIADVAHFVREGSALDGDARERGTSVYFPRRVVPMLPQALSAGVCALKQDEPRLAKSAFITYRPDGTVLRKRVANTLITSNQRLTYEQAQSIVDGELGAAEGFSESVVDLVGRMDRLARTIRTRRHQQGMLALDLPEVKLVLDDKGRVADARPARHIFSHTVIEMFMVEANEAVATLLAERDLPVIRRIHPSPEPDRYTQLFTFARACDRPLKSSGPPTRKALQELVASVRGKPEGYAINLALLRTFQQARYSTQDEGHYALASDCYCHFTSPIRRYPDLVVHRMVDRHLIGGEAAPEAPMDEADGADEADGMDGKTGESDWAQWEELAMHCSDTERRAEAAELELRRVLVLHYLADRQGESFEGVVTSVADFGVFVQSPRFLVEGLLRPDALGPGWWEFEPDDGEAYNAESGISLRVGNKVEVTIERVDVARRHLDLSLSGIEAPAPRRRRNDNSGKGKEKRGKGKEKRGKSKKGRKRR